MAEPKKIVYLWGAGATHAEAQHLGSTVNLLMGKVTGGSDFAIGVAGRTMERIGLQFSAHFGANEDIDVEKLITLLTMSGIKRHVDYAQGIRKEYFAELTDSLNQAGIMKNPKLANQLFRLHADPKFQTDAEVLEAVITTNHDGLLQLASQQTFGYLDLGFEYHSREFKRVEGSESVPIIQIHGSFTWSFGVPISVGRRPSKAKSSSTIWIPPTIEKDTRAYPFNRLNALAYEKLSNRCDVLRIVGSSLTQNDWNILSLIFNAQRHCQAIGNDTFTIELIAPVKTGNAIKYSCGFLDKILTIDQLSDGDYEIFRQGEDVADTDANNPLEYWLNQKILFHNRRGECDVEFLP